jgi:hypothetical protein
MTLRQFLKTIGLCAALAVVVLVGISITSSRGQAYDDEDNGRKDEASEIKRGFAIAPVRLNLDGKNRALVGLGSYIVNAQADCNGCHNPGPGANEFLPGGNPYFGQPKIINPAMYLGGGRDFGALVAGSAHIISRNLTPDKTGLPEGGHTFSEFVHIMRTGVDLDNLHPTCPAGVLNTGCVPAPFHGDLLQVMPWPTDKDMTDHDLRAIYEYLSAIPCISGPDAPDPRHNDCE